jgi:hypothetical protein
MAVCIVLCVLKKEYEKQPPMVIKEKENGGAVHIVSPTLFLRLQNARTVRDRNRTMDLKRTGNTDGALRVH